MHFCAKSMKMTVQGAMAASPIIKTITDSHAKKGPGSLQLGLRLAMAMDHRDRMMVLTQLESFRKF